MPWKDISAPLTARLPTWPGQQPFAQVQTGDIARVSTLSLSSHSGTHFDAPSHFLPWGKGVEGIPLDAGLGPARVIEVPHGHAITARDLAPHRIEHGSRLLIKTASARQRWTESEWRPHPGLTADGAEHLAALQTRLIGIDWLSIADPSEAEAVHRILLGAGIAVLEGLDLRGVAPGTYELAALPLSIPGVDGAPARAALRVDA